MRIRAPIVATLAVLLAGCASAHGFRVDGAPEYAPVEAEEVEVYETADDLPCPDVEKLARLEGSGGAYASRDKIVSAMREEAARHGADAVVLSGYSETSLGGALFGGEEASEARGLAVRLTCKGTGPTD